MAENNIDKKIEAVVGDKIEDAIKNEEPLEIEIVSEEVTVTDDPRDVLQDFTANLAEDIDESELNIISSDLMQEYENDKSPDIKKLSISLFDKPSPDNIE